MFNNLDVILVDNVSKVLELISMAGKFDFEKSECRGLHVVLHLMYTMPNVYYDEWRID